MKHHCLCCGTNYQTEEITQPQQLSVFGKHFHRCPDCGALNPGSGQKALPEATESHLLSCICASPKHKKHFQQAELPENAAFSVSTPILTDTTVPQQILCRHRPPEGTCGMLVVFQGNLQIVWEDTGVIHDADPQHPVLLYPDRYHHIQMDGPSSFRIDFYELPPNSPGDRGVSVKWPRESDSFFCSGDFDGYGS